MPDTQGWKESHQRLFYRPASLRELSPGYSPSGRNEEIIIVALSTGAIKGSVGVMLQEHEAGTRGVARHDGDSERVQRERKRERERERERDPRLFI